MKLSQLTRGTGKTAVWPVQWVEWPEAGEAVAVSEDGVLEGLSRFGSRLLLQINVGGRRRTASLEWDAPPTVGDVEVVLLASIGATIREIGNLEVPARGGRRA